jgi:hypothetical protein
MKSNLEAYRQSREVLMTSIITELSGDERCMAAWLTGSYGRNEEDEVSDLDITVVVAEADSKVLCARQGQVSHKTTPERLALFSRFGQPALIHENNHNAPEHGTLTSVLYAGSALMVDWVMIPLTSAERPSQSVLLFDKGNIPVASPMTPEDLDASQTAVAEQYAFFWMMMAITIKYLIRDDQVFVIRWLEELYRIHHEIERRIQRLPFQYRRGSLSQFPATREKQIESLKQLIVRMQELQPKITEFTGLELVFPLEEIETLLALTNE